MGYDDFKQSLQAVRLLPPCSYSSSQWEVLTSLLALLPILVAELQLLFQEHEAVDYIEVAQSALLALGDAQAPTDLALRLDYQIKHLLVDEFQDTSTTQFRLLEQLTAGWQPDDGRTLFLVGDPMQSIYRFRKAEVGLFLQACNSGIGNIPLKPLTLTVNFRATPPLVNWVNNTFQTLMPSQIDIGSGAVSFSSSLANNANQQQGEVFTHGLLLEDDNQEAQTISRLIQETWQNNSQQRIAILVRARTHLLEILPALQESNIPYRAIEIDTLAERPVIQDLLALTKALLHPADRIAWLAVLRAPWCGLTLMELQTVVGMDLTTTLWDRLINVDYAAFASPAKENLQRIVTVLQQSLKHRRRQPLATWIYGTWLALGGPASLTTKTDLEDTKVFFQLLHKLQKGEDIADLAQLEKQLSLLYAAPQLTNDNYVEVMTIHKAKGLEFDVVILPGLDRLLPADTPQLLLCMERPSNFGNTDLLLAPIKASAEDQDPIYNYLRHEEKTRANYETVRLLYVAVTRAKHSLHLIANLTPDLVAGIKKKQPNKNSLLAQLWPSLAEHFLTNIRAQDLQALVNDKITYRSHNLKRPTASWLLPKLPSGLTPEFIVEDSKIREKNNYYHWMNNPDRHIGTVVHQLLQTGLVHWDKKTVIEKQDYFRVLLTHLGVEPVALPNCLAQVTRALQNILDDERGRWILTNHEAAQAEFALTIVDGDEVQQIIIDRTFIDETGIRWIIDYKTSESDTLPLEDFLNHEVKRYRAQLEEYARIMQKIDANRPIRLGLYFPLLKAWREWPYEQSVK